MAPFSRSRHCIITAVVGGYNGHVADVAGRPSLTNYQAWTYRRRREEHCGLGYELSRMADNRRS